MILLVLELKKSGTTWLYERLKEHPDFAMPPIKELHYFDKGPAYPSPNRLKEKHLLRRISNLGWVKSSSKKTFQALINKGVKEARWLSRYYLADYSDSWYKSLFIGLDGITGDITPAYSMLSIEDIGKVHSLLPNIKLVFLMRDPIERAWSQYRFISRHFDRLEMDVDDIDTMLDFVHSDRQELRSNYQQTIERYASCFGHNRLLLGFYDAIANQPLALLEGVASFLGGNPKVVQETCKYNSRTHVSDLIPMPEKVLDVLREKYHDQIRLLAQTYGGYCQLWYNQHYGNGSGQIDLDKVSATILAGAQEH